MPSPARNVFLTGASSGIGSATADALLDAGFQVWGTSRRVERLRDRSGFHPVEMRLEEPRSIQQAWDESLRAAGQFEIVIQNAGAGLLGAIEDVSIDQSRGQWQVLVEGPLQILQLAAAHLRPLRGGIIIGVSSLAAELPMPFSAHYSAGKAAFSALLTGLAMELQPFGVKVVDLRPGDIRTSFNDDLPMNLPEGSPYRPWAQRAAQESLRLMQEAPPPELIAQGILRILAQTHPPSVVRLGTFFQARLGPLGVRVLSHRRLQHSIRRYFGLNQIDEQQRASS